MQASFCNGFLVNILHGYLLTESLDVAEHFAVSRLPGSKCESSFAVCCFDNGKQGGGFI